MLLDLRPLFDTATPDVAPPPAVRKQSGGGRTGKVTDRRPDRLPLVTVTGRSAVWAPVLLAQRPTVTATLTVLDSDDDELVLLLT